MEVKFQTANTNNMYRMCENICNQWMTIILDLSSFSAFFLTPKLGVLNR